MRSMWKGFMITHSLVNGLIKKPKDSKKSKKSKKILNLKKTYNKIIYDKSLVIVREYINNSFQIYNGIKTLELLVTSEMVGLKFGEFILTRKKHVFSRRKKKKKNNS